ncbi:MAG: hypothetical protein WC955_02970 [Elusimicrobiota bacterium]
MDKQLVRNKAAELSDEELIQIIKHDSADYEKDAFLIYLDEAKRRKLDDIKDSTRITKRNSSDYLDFSTLIEYAITNIYQINNIDELTSHFQTTIKDITEERNKTIKDQAGISSHCFDLINPFLPFLGQDTYFFKFQEGQRSFGEFSLDLLPVDSKEFLNNQLRLLAKIPTTQNSYKQVVNIRIQLFCDGILSNMWLKSKYKTVCSYITKKYGSPNQSPLANEPLNNTLQYYGSGNVNCWFFKKNDTNYLILLNYFKGKIGLRGYISFSVSELV